MNIYQPDLTMILNNGKVVLVYDNGYKIRTLQSEAGITCYGPINEEPKGVRYWKYQALEALDCTIQDVLMQTKKDKVCFKN
jgi:hypothetical protein